MQSTPVVDTAACGYSTQAVAEATGIPVTTILAWERRYGLPQPRRTETGRRVYSESDLTLLQAMRARTADGERAEQVARDLLRCGGNPAAARRRLPVYLPTEVQELFCLHCGDACGELLTQRTAQGVVVRFVPQVGASAPRPGTDGRPRCGRCAGGLYREPGERRSLPPLLGEENAARTERGAA